MLAAAISGLVGVVALSVLPDPGAAGVTHDGAQYVRMATEGIGAGGAPFGYRVMFPFIVSLLPFETGLGFHILTVAGLSATSALLAMWVIRRAGRRWAALAVLLFWASPTFVYALQNPYLVDPLAYALMVGMLFAADLRRWWLLAALTVVGVLTKESVLFAFVPVLAAGLLRRDRVRVVAGGAGAAAGVLTYWAVRRLPLAEAPLFDYLTAGNLELVLESRAAVHGSAPMAAVATFVFVFGPLWPLVVGVGARIAEVRYLGTLLIPVVASMAIATDWPRMLAFGFPALILAAVMARPTVMQSATLVSSVAALTAAAVMLRPGPMLYLVGAVAMTIGVAAAVAALRSGTVGESRWPVGPGAPRPVGPTLPQTVSPHGAYVARGT
ncbi:hypothetical protein ACVGVM_27100 [Pseudonocardia bannensis]|uniref:Glycosyltransferase RgtA/B/C/D-like domain-containing protein n=1 Tax=Pseudonocardia bannensis TaxID=630973 RepID=A0A848DH84_9PSEU|nr:hypothetical protein [Pseudonocardia bannensis]NMH91915.1 hypothetical protein [Pseudonocardia bannensis]